MCLRRTDNGRTAVSRRISLSRKSALYRALTVTFDLTLKTIMQFRFTWWIFVTSLIEISPLSIELSLHVENFWPRYGLDLWPRTSEIFSAVSTHMANIYAKFHWNPSSKYRDISSRERDVNGPISEHTTAGQPDGLSGNIMPFVGGESIITICLISGITFNV